MPLGLPWRGAPAGGVDRELKCDILGVVPLGTDPVPSMLLSLALIALPQSLPVLPRGGGAAVLDVVEVRIEGAREWEFLYRFATDIDDHFHAPGRARIFADDAEQSRLARIGLELVVVREDLVAWHAAQAGPPSMALQLSGGSFGGFRTYDEMALDLLQLQAQYPNVVSQRIALGTTWQGRTVWGVRVSNTPNAHDPTEPVVWYDALHHAREPIGGEAVMRFLEHLAASYGSDDEVTRLVDRNNLILIPCVNPDGYEFNRVLAPSGGGMWRKNMAALPSGALGVDLNRNYDWEWGPQWPGSSSSEGSHDYHGPGAFSEPETQALRDFAAANPPDLVISCHSYGEYCLMPWGYDAVTTPDDFVLRTWSERFAEPLAWGFGTPWETLGFANGNSLDYLYGTYGALAFAFEIGSAVDGFWPQGARIDELCDDVLPAFQRLARLAGPAPRLSPPTLVEVQGDGDAWKEPGELWSVRVTIENEGREELTGVVRIGLPAVLADLQMTPENLVLAPHAVRDVEFGFRIAQDAPTGQRFTLRAELETPDGLHAVEIVLAVGEGRPIVVEGFDVHEPGWTTEGSGSGGFERTVPALVVDAVSAETTQPAGGGSGAPGGVCFVTGGQAGAAATDHDVDGWTRLESPRLDLADFGHVELELARWFTELPGAGLGGDALLVELSNDDGATWTELAHFDPESAWRTERLDLAGALPLTDAMRVRFTVRDDPDDGLTEALVDDLRFLAITEEPRLTAFGRSLAGDAPRLFLCAPELAGKSVELRRALVESGGVSLPGIQGTSLLGSPSLVLWSGTLDADGLATVPIVLQPWLLPISGELCFQALLDPGGQDAAWSNLVRLPVTSH